MNEYTLVYAKPVNTGKENILLILKEKPDWQKGRLNLPGGKIQENESILDCAVRELKEETGLDAVGSATLMGQIVGDGYIVYCVKVPVFQELLTDWQTEEGIFAWMDWLEVKDSKLILPNLRIIVPLMVMGVTDWIIQGDDIFNIEFNYGSTRKV